MAKTKVVRLTDEELAALEAFRNAQKASDEAPAKAEGITDAQQALADAFVSAIERTRPPEKKTVFTRKEQTPWTPKDGSPKLKMKRVFYQHGIPIGENVDNETIALLNQLKPGHYCDGFVRVTLRKDRGIDISYPVRTASQRLKLVNTYGIRSFAELLVRIIDERNFPKKYRKPEDADLFDLE
jgi:hypothetical protein